MKPLRRLVQRSTLLDADNPVANGVAEAEIRLMAVKAMSDEIAPLLTQGYSVTAYSTVDISDLAEKRLTVRVEVWLG